MTNIQPDYQTPERMAKKLQAIELPDFEGKRVLDVGCDMRFWCNLAKERGAREVIGIDRGRFARGQPINMADHVMDLGKQWHELGKFDVILMLSMYHHAYQSAGGDHDPIWFWLWRHLEPSGVVIWESPLNADDVVVKKNVASDFHYRYNDHDIIVSASRYFDIDYIGPALHETTRYVLNAYPKQEHTETYTATLRDGAGGASKAFVYEENRRMKEIEHILGFYPYPGSLNVSLDAPFDWSQGYYRAQVLDVKNRREGLDSEWIPRWARFYPVNLGQEKAFAFRFEGDNYPKHFVELISPNRLRDSVKDHETLWR